MIVERVTERESDDIDEINMVWDGMLRWRGGC